MTGPSQILRTLAAGGSRGHKLAGIICDLVAKGGQLGELIEYDHPDPALRRNDGAKCRRMPHEWLVRLDKAIETEAIDWLGAERIVEILLQGRP
jgi:hypothetical protein